MKQLTRREFMSTAARGAALGLLAPALAAGAAPQKEQKKMNVLFIAVDDLRPQLGCYGHKQILSPNIDALAKRGTVFRRAYCQQAVCAPSRASLMSGCRPDTTKIYDLKTPLRTAMPKVLSLPQHFKASGYRSVSLGKIYHHLSDDRIGWTAPPWRAKGKWRGRGYLTKEAQGRIIADSNGRGPAYEAADVGDDDYADGLGAEKAIAELRRLKDKPFFLAVGFFKPHLPFNAPKKYWDLYRREDIKLPANRDWPKNMPPVARSNWGELRNYAGMPKRGRLTDDQARTLIHGYYACVSYVDAQVGRLTAELDRLHLRDSTVIILWGDHGWKLGEYSAWCKHTNFELDTRAPVVLSAPGRKAPGKATDALVEFVDIYPTLCELCGLEVPKHCEGTSMAPLLDDPARKWKQAAFSQYPRGRIMGYTMRTDRWRYTEWRQRKDAEVTARELYDHKTDPGENVNLAGGAEHAETLKRLAAMLKGGPKAARPGK